MPPSIDTFTTFRDLAISLALGLLIGLQRERTQTHLAGIRTFALIALLGTICALMSTIFGAWLVAVGLLGVALMFFAASLTNAKTNLAAHGLTTEIAALLTFGVGAYLVVGEASVAVALGGTVALLLYWKEPLHQFARRISPDDIRAIMQFVLISLVILPVLPNKTYGPYNVLNPFEIWLIVVLIVGIALAGYVAYQIFGQRGGTLLLGVLGGMVSSTATTVSYARRSREAPDTARLALVIIMIATAISYVRFMVEVGVADGAQFFQVALPLAVMLGLSLILAVLPYWRLKGDDAHRPNLGNPAELKPAIIFGVLYAVVLITIAAARQYFGHTGLYTVAALSGLTDVDALNLSTARLMALGQLHVDTGWRVILVATLVNLGFKAVLVGFLGSRALLARVTALYAVMIGVGVLMLIYWS